MGPIVNETGNSLGTTKEHALRVLIVLALVLFMLTSCATTRAPRPMPEGIPVEIETLLNQLRSSDPVERGRAVKKLGERESHVGIPFIIDLLSDGARCNWKTGTTVAERAINALKLQRRAAVMPLCDALAHEPPAIRRRAASILGDIADSRAIDSLIDALADRDATVRRHAHKALVKITGLKLGYGPKKWIEWRSNDKTARPQDVH